MHQFIFFNSLFSVLKSFFEEFLTMIFRSKTFFIFFSILTFHFLNPLFSYSLEDYLQEVQNSNLAFKASDENKKMVVLKNQEPSLRFMPALFSTIQAGSDKKKTNQTAFIGEEPSSVLSNIGIEKQFRNGLQGRVAYKINYYSFKGASPTFVPENSYFEAFPTFELQYPISRNFKGRELKATETIAQKQYEILSILESRKQLFILMDADMSYWRLFLAREIVRIQEKSLEQAYKLKEWINKKQQLNLYDRSDLYQAEAAYKFHEIELLNAKNEEASAKRAFNFIRGKEGDEVEGLSDELKPYFEQARQHFFSEHFNGKIDTKSLKLQTDIASLNALVIKEKSKPEIYIGSSLSLNHRSNEISQAISPNFNYPTFGIAITLSGAIAPKTHLSIIAGYQKEAEASEKNLAYKKFEEVKEFQELRERFGETLRKYELCLQLEDIQKNKYKNELSRQEKGRTTIYQVLMFEQDYLNAQLNRIRVTSELVAICAKAREFRGEIHE